MAAYPLLRSDLIVSPSTVDGQPVYTIKDPVTEKYFQLREPEYWLISQLDGATANDDIARRFGEKFGMSIDAASVGKFVEALGRSCFLDDGRAEAASRLSGSKSRRHSLFSRLLFIRLPGLDPSPLLRRLLPLYRPFHHPFWLSLGLVAIGVGLALFLANASSFSLRGQDIFQVGSLALIIATIFVTLVVHEFAHALTCHYYGGEVREMGFLLLFFQPCFYADVSDAWLFPKKSHRLTVTWAGPFMQFLTFALAVIIWRVTVPESPPSKVAEIIILVSGISVLFNFNPLIKLDGYYLLSDWVELPNLRERAFRYLRNWLQRVVLGWPVSAIPARRRERRIFLSYALLATIYSGLLIGIILVIVGKFLLAQFGGWGLLALTLLLAVVLKSNIASVGRGLVQHLGYMSTSLRNPFRLVAYCFAAGSLFFGLVAVPFPLRVSGEVVVRPIEEFSLLLNEFGLLERTLVRRGEDPESKTGYMQMVAQDMASLDLAPLVSDGQQVMAGDTVALLLSNQLTSQLEAARSELQRLERELALLQSPPKPEAVAEAATEVKAAQTTFDRKQREFERLKGLRDREMISNEQYEEAESGVAIAEAELANREARLQLLKSPPKPEQEAVIRSEIDKQRARVQFLQTQEEAQSITTPINGTVRIAPEGGTILSVLESSAIEVLVPVSDFDIDLVSEEQPLLLKVRSFPDRLFRGEVRHVPSTAVEADGSARFSVSAVVPNADYQLASGMTGYAKIDIGKTTLAAMAGRKLASFVRVEFWSWW